MVEQLREEIYHVDGLSAANVFVVEHDGVSLIDAGTPGDASDIRAAVEAAGLAVSDIDRVLLTHYDYDHVGSLATLEGLDATVYAHEPDAAFLAGTETPGLWPHKALLQRVTGLLMDLPDCQIEPVTEGTTVAGFRAYHTPGHGPGHLAWINESFETAFLGDLVRETDGTLEPSPWYVSYDAGQVERSIRELADRAPSFAVAGMGHGTPLTTDGSGALERLAGSLG